jgi:hypothetical protein
MLASRALGGAGDRGRRSAGQIRVAVLHHRDDVDEWLEDEEIDERSDHGRDLIAHQHSDADPDHRGDEKLGHDHEPAPRLDEKRRARREVAELGGDQDDADDDREQVGATSESTWLETSTVLPSTSAK